jgi:2-oxoisovalerate dehydrogenase E1 component alpha subunit
VDLLVANNLDFLQLIDRDGHPTGAAELDDALVERLPDLYGAMVATREVDEEMINLQRQGQLSLYPSARGQEAAQIGCAAALRSTDWLFPQYREIGVFLQRGIEPGGIGLAWRGTWHGGFGFLERFVAPMSVPIGTQALHAVGAAMASKWLDDEGVTVAFFGDGAISEGDVHEAFNLAAVKQSPCIFFVQNNQWAISTPISEQMRATSISLKGVGYGMPAVRVDGNDVAACFAAVSEAATRARDGGGPTLIEAVTYRLGAHTTADDATRYRDDAEVKMWEAQDPILRIQRFLESCGKWSEEFEEQVHTRTVELRRQLRETVVDAPDVSPLEVFEFVYTEMPLDLIAQRTQLAQELGIDI